MAEGQQAQQVRDQWYLEIDGQTVGPYTLAQVMERVRGKTVLLSHKITAAHLNGKWITVGELARPPSSKPSVIDSGIPPRPDEKTLHAISVSGLRGPAQKKSDALVDLYNFVQSSREKKPHKRAPLQHNQSGDNLKSNPIWTIAPVLTVGLAAVWGISTLISTTSSRLEQHSEPSAKMAAHPASTSATETVAATKPVTAPAPAAIQPVTRVAERPPAPSVGHSLQLSRGSVAAAPRTATPAVADRDQERDREREREREIEKDRERDREQANAGNGEEPRDQERENERENKERGRERAERNLAGTTENGAQNPPQENAANPQPETNALGYPVDGNGNVLPPANEGAEPPR